MQEAKETKKRTVRIQVQLTEEELQSLDEWRFANRIPSRAAAIRELMRLGLTGTTIKRNVTNKKSTDYGLV